MNNELKGLRNDRKRYEIELTSYQNKYAEMLKNDMGKDIKDVLSGKTKVKLSFKEKIKKFIDDIFNII